MAIRGILNIMLRRLFMLVPLLFPLSAGAGTGLPAPEQIAPHTWAWIGPYGPPTKENSGFRMNLGFVVGKDTVAVIDSGFGSDMASAMLEQIARITDRPVAWVINTNSQPHRVLGNATFKREGADILAAEEAATRFLASGAAMAGTAEEILGVTPGTIPAPGNPDLPVVETEKLDLGGVTLNVIPIGTAHTAGSVVVEVPEDGTVFAGDVLYGGRLLAVLPVSQVENWIEAFDKLRDFEDSLFVPGHGKPGRLADFEHSTYRYLTTLKAHMDEAVEQGSDMQDAIDSLDQGEWQQLADFEALAGRNAHQTYLEREEAAFE